jgi:tRNA (cmo5U34)-methyltransferase
MTEIHPTPDGLVTVNSPSVKEQAERAQQEIRERWEAEGKNGPLTILPGQGDLLSEQAPIEIPEHWTFKDSSVAEGFDRHVREQLPWYDLVTDAIVQIGRHFIGEGGLVYDIGASTGNIGRALDATIQDRHGSLIAVEESPQMAAKWWGPGSLFVEPIQNHCKDMLDYDFAVLNLVLMFLRADEQAQVLDCLQKHIKPGGALVLVERMIPPAGYLSIVNSRLTLAAKLKAGVPAEDIVTKELSIAGSQRPIEASVLLAHGAVEWFRYGDFAGWIITRETPRYSH